MSFFAELRRRNVLRVAGLYLVGAWLLVQVVGTVLPMFGAPDWIARSVVLLLAIGFVPALLFAWVFELTPQGLRRDGEAGSGEAMAPRTAQRLNRTIFAVLVLAVAYFAVDKFVLSTRIAPPVVEGTPVAATLPGAPVGGMPRPEAAAPVPEKSIAVLAFANMSADAENEYFSDGIAEEILNSLAALDDLKVAGRTSSFSFKGRNEDLRAIGKALGVAHILEGSVRKQGQRVRITAQLIRSADGTHLWSETYDGTLDDIFALQERIAQAITSELKLVLSGDGDRQLVDTGTRNSEAYAQYLQATAIFNRREGDRFAEAIAALDQAIRLDPGYARAHSRLAALYAILPSYTDADVLAVQAMLERYAASASSLDPTLAEPYAALGFSLGKFPGRIDEHFAAMEKALALDPDDVTTNFWFGLGLIKAGYTRRGERMLDHGLTLDPMLPNLLRWRGLMYWHAGDAARGESMVRRAKELGLQVADFTLALIIGNRISTAEATALWRSGTTATWRGLSPVERRILPEGIFGDPSARQRALEVIDVHIGRNHGPVSQMVPLSLLQLGEPGRALAVLADRQVTDTSDSLAWVWSPRGKPARELPEFDAYLREFGFTEAWDVYGAPDHCRRIAAGQYACD